MFDVLNQMVDGKPAEVESVKVKTVHFCGDIETLDTAATAVILQIGIVAFTQDGLIDGTSWNVKPQTQFTEGRTFSDDTLNWWLSGKGGKLDTANQIHIWTALENLAKYRERIFDRFVPPASEDSTMWSNGTDFDISTLSHAHNKYGLTVPWEYNSVRDIRTWRKSGIGKHALADFIEVNPKPHDALQDAIYEAKQIIHINRWLVDRYGAEYGFL